MKRRLAFSLCVFLAAVTAYYGAEIAIARGSTPRLVAAAAAKIRDPVSLSDVPERRLAWLLRVQDPNFFEHRGTDLLSGRVTTITQSLVKHLYFDDFKPGLAKIRQTLIARFALDPLTPKQEQLFLFLNLTYFGHSGGREVRGFPEASRAYFGTDFLSISDEQYLGLLAMLSGPNEFHVKHAPRKERRASGFDPRGARRLDGNGRGVSARRPAVRWG